MADLINITEYKAFASISSTNSDASLTVLIPMVSDFVKAYCGRNFVNNTTADPVGTEAPVVTNTPIVEYFSNGGRYIYLREAPLISLTSVEQKLYPGADYTAITSQIHYEYDQENECLVSLLKDGFPRMPNAVKITYTGGYSSTPEDLKLGIFALIKYYLKDESVPRKSINHNQISTEYVQSADLPAHIKRVFDLYRIIT